MALAHQKSRRHFVLLRNGGIVMKDIRQEQFTKAVGNSAEINELLRRYGVKFGIYKNGVFNEQFFPFDPIPRVISAADFKSIEKGLVQRVNALNEFLFDIYHERRLSVTASFPRTLSTFQKAILPSARASRRRIRFTVTFRASTWYRRKTACGISLRTTCAYPRARHIRLSQGS